MGFFKKKKKCCEMEIVEDTAAETCECGCCCGGENEKKTAPAKAGAKI